MERRCRVSALPGGADAHIDDPLGGLLDDDQLARRDELVFDYCHAKSLPVAWCLAGGYQRDELGTIEPVLRIHRRTMESAIHAYSPLHCRQSAVDSPL